MKELKILLLLIVITGIIYWGVEPLAHSVMHPHVSPPDYTFRDSIAPEPTLESVRKKISDEKVAELQEQVLQGRDISILSDEDKKQIEDQIKMELEKQAGAIDTEAEKLYKEQLQEWGHKNEEVFAVTTQLINDANAANGAELVTGNCIACHSIETQGFAQAMDNATLSSTYGVVPPDLSHAGYIYDSYYLFNIIKDPAVASKVSHKFADGTKAHPMIAYKDINSDEEIADMVAYLKNIAPKELDDKQVFLDACVRCHSVKYDDVHATSTAADVNAYMGVRYIPDLSMIVRARSLEYLHTFINDPQKLLPGTSMPRVGLNENAEKQIIAYLESVGDSKKEQRETLGIYIMIFFVIMAVLAYFWKQRIWNKLH